MKKLYFSITALFFAGAVQSQTLTLAANEPTVGDVNTTRYYDSIGVVPKNTGANQSWNFGTYTLNPAAQVVKNFTTAASVPSSSIFPGTTLVEIAGNGDRNYWKSASTPTTQFELLGIDQPSGVLLNFTNSAVAAIWPVTFGSTLTDVSSGTVMVGSSGSMNSTISVEGTGTGTITLPGGLVFSNILQVRTMHTITLTIGGGPATASIISTTYDYYHSSQKFPMLTVAYETEVQSSGGTPTVTLTNKIKGNKMVLTGLNDMNFEAAFQIFPNPAKGAFQVNLDNASRETGSIIIYDHTGKAVRHIILENDLVIRKHIGLQGLSAGIYVVKTSLGNRSSARKLVVE
jgi:hypothetical protein